jgi:hypothetical protein
VLDSARYTLIDGASESEELEQQLRRAAHNLQQHNTRHPVVHTSGKLPPGAILATDVIEWKKKAS